MEGEIYRISFTEDVGIIPYAQGRNVYEESLS